MYKIKKNWNLFTLSNIKNLNKISLNINLKLLATIVAIFVCRDSRALPFNQDMVGRQLTNGQIMRPYNKDSVPVNSSSRYIRSKDESASLQNPVPSTETSRRTGERLYQINCSPCHGRYIENKYIPGALSTYLPAPNLSQEFYAKKPDGHYFQFIHYGGMAIMPAYGYKLSISEHWDIINYIRNIQANVVK